MALTNVKIGITIGDKNGIGPEVILNSLKDNRILSGITPVIYGSEDVLKHYMSKLAMENLVIKRISSADKAQVKTINVINVLDEEISVNEGKEEGSSGVLAIKSIEMASMDISSGKIDAIVTAPISKSVCQNAGFDFLVIQSFLLLFQTGLKA